MTLPPGIAEKRKSLQDLAQRLEEQIIGQTEAVQAVLFAAVLGGHVLLEGMPGLGKTELVKTLAAALRCKASRIQFTPDLMPADILGTTVLAKAGDGSRSFRFEKGPVFAHIVLADEINRASPKTQAALLEAMQEGTVTAGNERLALPDPFLVLATQNPIDLEGTFPLPEAQLDRFLFKSLVRDPPEKQLVDILSLTENTRNATKAPIMGVEGLLTLRAAVRAVILPPSLLHYAASLVVSTRPDFVGSPDLVRRYARWGASPRGAQAILRSARVRAFADGRPNVCRRDIDASCHTALRHRIGLSFDAHADKISADDLIDAVIASTSPPPIDADLQEFATVELEETAKDHS